MRLRRSVLAALLGCLPLAAAAGPVGEAPIPCIVGLEGSSGASLQAALGPIFDGSKFSLAPAPAVLAPVLTGVPGLALEAPHTPDRTAPDAGGAAELTPGSIFQWRPAQESPGHGFAPIDALVRRLAAPKDRRFDAGFAFSNSERASARVFLYGERHSDKTLIAENMRRLAEDMREGKGALILDEGYMGPALFGSEAIRYLEAKGFDPAWLGAPGGPVPSIEVRGWDSPELYDRSRSITLRYTMALYELNQHLFSEASGFGYYAELARRSSAAAQAWLAARRTAIGSRNGELDRQVASAIARAEGEGLTVHVIAGGEHLLEHPLLLGIPGFGASPRARLAEAIGKTPYFAAMPASSPAATPSAQELAFAASASLELAKAAEDVGAERGLKASRMTGKDFIEMIEAGRVRYGEQARAKAPSARALTAALAVQASVTRVARALLDPSQPLAPQMPRLLSVWSVFNQEMGTAAEKATLEAVEAESRLFAEQVESSV